jgi:hypothetical protein
MSTTRPEVDSDVVTSAMFRRALRSPAAERTWIESCLAGNGLTDEEFEAQVLHRMARHAAQCAWAEVEYRAASAGNAAGAGLYHQSPPVERMTELLQVAYTADTAIYEALGAVREAEFRAEAARRKDHRP